MATSCGLHKLFVTTTAIGGIIPNVPVALVHPFVNLLDLTIPLSSTPSSISVHVDLHNVRPGQSGTLHLGCQHSLFYSTNGINAHYITSTFAIAQPPRFSLG